MTETPKEPSPGSQDDPHLDKRLERLRSQLSHGKSETAHEEREQEQRTESKKGMAQAFRLSSEFIAGIVVGAGIGYLIDAFFGTSPSGLIVFLLLGFCAAVVNVMRAAGLMVKGSYETVNPTGQTGERSRDDP